MRQTCSSDACRPISCKYVVCVFLQLVYLSNNMGLSFLALHDFRFSTLTPIFFNLEVVTSLHFTSVENPLVHVIPALDFCSFLVVYFCMLQEGVTSL